MSADPLQIVEGPINAMGECLEAPDVFTFDIALTLPGFPNVYLTMLLAQINPLIELLQILLRPPLEWPELLVDFSVNFPNLVLEPFTANLNTLICSDGSTIPGLEIPLPDIVPSGIDPSYFDAYDCSVFIPSLINLISCPFFLIEGLILDPLLEVPPRIPPLPTIDLIIDIILPVFEAAFPFSIDVDPLYLPGLVECFATASLSVFEEMFS